MSTQSNTFWMLSLLAATIANREQLRLDNARRVFDSTFAEDAALIIIDTQGEVVEAQS